MREAQQPQKRMETSKRNERKMGLRNPSQTFNDQDVETPGNSKNDCGLSEQERWYIRTKNLCQF